MKKTVFILFILAIAGLSLPLLNYYFDFNSKAQLPTPVTDSLKFAETRAVLNAKCLHCHSARRGLPFYASWPGAKQMIQSDVNTGMEFINFDTALSPPPGHLVSEVTLSKLEFTTVKDSMPIWPYRLMHWRSFMTGAAKAAVLGWVEEARQQFYSTPGVAPEFKTFALQPLPDSVPVDVKKAELGRKLYNDTRLSGDNTVSCATCHGLNKGGADQEKTSTGIRGQKGPINSPTTFNSGFNFVQFWDGRAKDLEEQAGGPVNNPLEMGSNWEQVIGKLKQDAAFQQEFAGSYPDGLNGKNIQNAIAEFEKTLITPNSRFDQHLKGTTNVLNTAELDGLHLFMDRGCYTCHTGKLLGGQSFEKMGRYRDYFKMRGIPLTDADQGRFNATKNPKDLHYFKVPMLRNIALTAPYFHDGSTTDLKEAVQIMAKVQTEASLSDADAQKVVQFLKTLTGQYQGKSLL